MADENENNEMSVAEQYDIDVETIASQLVQEQLGDEQAGSANIETQTEETEKTEAPVVDSEPAEETSNNQTKTRPRASEILAIARREKALKEKEASLETKAAEIAEQRVNEFITRFMQNPQAVLGERELPSDQVGRVATDLWYSQLDEEDQPEDFKQLQYMRTLENKIAHLEQRLEQSDPTAAIQKAEQERQAATYLGELQGLAKNSEVIGAVFGENASEVLWNTASQLYQATNVVPSAAEVIETVENQMLDYVNKLSQFAGKSEGPPKRVKSAAAKTISTSETPRTRRYSNKFTSEDVLKEAEALVKNVLE